MSTLGFDIGVSALLTAQSRLETIGHNLANATTPGYSRQSTLVSAATPQQIGGLFRGGGVQADMIQRSIDAVLNSRIAQQSSSLGLLGANVDMLSHAETFLGGLSESGPGKLLEKMFAGFSSLSTSPGDSVLRSSAVRTADTLAARMNQLADDVQTLTRTAESSIEAGVDRVNELAGQISTLTHQIVDSEFSHTTANDLRDARERAVRELAGFVGVQAIEDEHGGMRVLVDGHMLVSPNAVGKMTVLRDPTSGALSMKLGGQDVQISGGQIGGLMHMAQNTLPKLSNDVDTFTRNLIYELNRVHATGVGVDGPYQSLQSSYAVSDQDGDGSAGDELLTNAGLPFQVQTGELVVQVTDRTSGQVTTQRIPIDAARTTVNDFLTAIDSLPHMAAQLDAQGKLQIQADSGYGFDFSARLDAAPDRIGSFGSGRASLGTAGQEPFALAAGDTLDFSGTLGTFSVAFQAGSFANIGAATADEVASVLNADASFTQSGLRASTVAGSLVVQTTAAGATQSFTVQSGTALGAFGWNAGQVVDGSDVDVAAQISGTYTGATNGALVFRANMDGAIGTTPGLLIGVYDQSGAKLADLHVGAGYHPGDELEVVDGVKVAFGFGQVSATDHDVFQVEVIADSDTAHVLPAFGVNGLFDGLDASSIAVRQDIVDDPDRLAASRSGAVGDASNLLRMIAVESDSLAQLGGASLDERFSEIVGDIGFELQSSSDAHDAEQVTLSTLETRREQISGVNPDEELVEMIEQQQAYAAAAQYLRVINDITNELLQIL